LLRRNWLAGVLCLFGFLAALESIWNLGIGGARNPGPGFMPLLSCVFLVLSSGRIFLEKRTKVFRWNSRSLIKGGGIAAAIAGAGAGLEAAGFRIVTFLLMCLLLRLFGFRRWFVISGLSLAIAIGTDLLFSSVLGLILPRSPWGI
jgi:hypothetical protein